jgi:hypothetical protein
MNDSPEEQLKDLYGQLNQRHESHRAELLARLAASAFDKSTSLSAKSDCSRNDHHPTSPNHRSAAARASHWLSRLSLTVATLVIISLSLTLFRDVGVSRVAYADVVAHFDRKFTYEVTVTFPGMPDSVEYRFNVEKDSRTGRVDPSKRELAVESPRGTHRAVLDSEGRQISGSFQPNEAQALAQKAQRWPASQRGLAATNGPSAEELAARTDWLNVLRHCAGTATPLGQKKVNEADVVGYEVESNGANYTLWAEQKSGVPVLLEIVASYLPGKLELANFTFD